MTCFPEDKAVNPINAAVLGAFGPNYFPLYNTNFQPTKSSDLTNEKLLEIITSGGGKIKPTGGPKLGHISEIVSTVLGAFGAIFAVFAPLFLILELIRNMIDMLCALINPVPLVLTLVEMFVTTIPGIIALYPYFSSILLAINTAKILIATCAAMISAMTPIAETIVLNALEIPDRIAEGNGAAVDAIVTKVCILVDMFANQLGGFAPFSFIIDLLKTFLGLGGRLFCLQEAACCDAENCPPIIINPPAGRAIVRLRIFEFTMFDLIQFFVDLINIPLGIASDFLNRILPDIFEIINEGIKLVIDGVNGLIKAAIGPINDAIEDIFQKMIDIIEFIPGIGGIDAVQDLLDDLSEAGVPDIPADLAFPPLVLATPVVNLLLPDAPEGFDDFVIIPPRMFLELLELPVSTENDAGRISVQGIGNPYTREEFDGLKEYVIDPFKIPEPDPDDHFPSTLKIDVTSTISGGTAFGANIIFVAAPPTLLGVTPPAVIEVRADNFGPGTIVEYRVRPEEITLFKMNLIGLGCLNEVANAAAALPELIKDVGGTASGQDKIGRDFPDPPLFQLQGCIDAQEADPTVSQAECAAEILNDYIEDLTDYTEDAVCAIASGSQSDFIKDKIYVTADGSDFSTLSLTPKEIGGTALLTNPVPNLSFRAVFSTNFGKIQDLPFDAATGTFQAKIFSNEVGTAQVTAKLVVKDDVCFQADNFDGFSVTQNIQEVVFRLPPETFRKRRRRPDYIQSSGGRRR